MKKIEKRTVALMALALAAIAAAAVNTITYSATYDFGNLTLGTDTLGGVTYTTVRYDGLPNYGEPGNPFLPVDYIKFSVPWNATNFRVTAVLKYCNLLQITNPVYPSQQNSVPPTIVPPNNLVYYSGDFFPPQGASFIDEGFLAGENRIVTVAVTPVSCIHDGRINQLRTAQTIGLTLSYDLTDTPYICPLVRRDTTLRNKGFELAREIVANPDYVRANAFSGNPGMLMSYPMGPQEPEGPAETFLIVATPQSLRPMRRLAALRQQKGMNVKVVTINEALTDTLAGQGDLVFHGGDSTLTYTDDAGKLRQYLRMHYLYRGTEYALLSGTGIPYREKAGGQADLYFSDFDYDWRTEFDKYAEVFVGRLLGVKSNQFDNYTDKLFRYELNPGNGDRTYLQKALFTCQEKYEGIENLSYGITQVCPDTTYLLDCEGGNRPTGNDVINAINTKHFGFIGSFNDGTPSYIKTQSDESTGLSHYLWAIDTVKVAPSYWDNETGNGLNRMLNKDYPNIYFSGIGQTMPYSHVDGYDIDVNFGESFTMGKDYGGPVYMGLTADFSKLEVLYLAGGFDANSIQKYTLGVTYAKARQEVNGDFAENLLTRHNYLGDPLIKMWTCAPQTYSSITVSRLDSTINVSGVPVGANVSYCSNSGAIGIQNATSSVVTFSHVCPNSTIMIHDDNHLPFIAPMVLQNKAFNKSQYVIAEDVLAGYSVDSSRTSGDVTVTDGAEFEIEAAGEVTLSGGFSVEQGSSFAVYPSSYK